MVPSGVQYSFAYFLLSHIIKLQAIELTRALPLGPIKNVSSNCNSLHRFGIHNAQRFANLRTRQLSIRDVVDRKHFYPSPINARVTGCFEYTADRGFDEDAALLYLAIGGDGSEEVAANELVSGSSKYHSAGIAPDLNGFCFYGFLKSKRHQEYLKFNKEK